MLVGDFGDVGVSGHTDVVARNFVDSITVSGEKTSDIAIENAFGGFGSDFAIDGTTADAVSFDGATVWQNDFEFSDVFSNAAIFTGIWVYGSGGNEATDSIVIVAVNWYAEAIYGENLVELSDGETWLNTN